MSLMLINPQRTFSTQSQKTKINKFLSLGDKLCWVLHVTEFLRANEQGIKQRQKQSENTREYCTELFHRPLRPGIAGMFQARES